jgi:hypothetical protein
VNALRRLAGAGYRWLLRNGTVRNLARGIARRRTITGFTEFCPAPPTRRALVSYLVLPLLPPPALRERVVFSNRGIAQQLVQGLNELGFAVDIVNSDNLTFRPTVPYDLFLGHGGRNFEAISRALRPGTRQLYFATGIYWREFNAREARRFCELAERTGYLLPPDRYVKDPEEYANETADGIICLGNAATARTYARFRHVVAINNAVFPLEWQGHRDKDYEEGRKHFLFFSGPGNVHKGLDRLLEAVAGLDLHLHVCQELEPDFERIYRRELRETPNVHVHGFIPMRSPAFGDLARRCNWVILPTCAEGQPGSVIECMAHGLVPVLPDEANIDLEDWGVRLPDCAVDTLRDEVLRAGRMAPDECRDRAGRVVDATRQRYSVEYFRSSFKRAVADILDTRLAKV